MRGTTVAFLSHLLLSAVEWDSAMLGESLKRARRAFLFASSTSQNIPAVN